MATESGQLNFRLLYVIFFITNLLAPAQLWTMNLVLFEQIAWLCLDFPFYRQRTGLRLNCQVFDIGMTNRWPDVTCLHSVANVEVRADALVRC